MLTNLYCPTFSVHGIVDYTVTICAYNYAIIILHLYTQVERGRRGGKREKRKNVERERENQRELAKEEDWETTVGL